MGPDAMILVFWMLSFKPTFSLSSFLFLLFLKRWVRWSGIPISFRIFHSLLLSTQQRLRQRLWCSQWSRSKCFSGTLTFLIIQGMLAIWSLVPLPFLASTGRLFPTEPPGKPSSAFSKSILNIWKFMVHVLLKPGLENFEHYFTSMWDECNCVVVWTFLGIAFLWDCNENWHFPVLWPLLSFPNLLAQWVQHFHSIIF